MARYLFLIFAILLFPAGNLRADNAHMTASFTLTDLDEHGEWVIVTGYGRVWRPYSGPDWRPFRYGRWAWTDDGWLWESDEPFGWIVCHYGNWFYDDDYGWVWIPGYEWSPARVEWHVTDYEIGWLPLFPAPIPGRPHARMNSHWMFCPVGVFASVDLHSRVVVRSRPASGRVTVYRTAPDFVFVQRATPRKIVRVAPQRVTVRSAQNSFVRVEVSGHAQRRVVVPAGASYKAVRKAPGATVTVESYREAPSRRTVVPSGSSVIIRSEQESDRHNVTAKKKKVTVKKK